MVVKKIVEFDLFEIINDAKTYDEVVNAVAKYESNCDEWDFTLLLLTKIMKNASDVWEQLESIHSNTLTVNFIEQLKIAYNAVVRTQKTTEVNQNIDTINDSFIGVKIDRIG